MQADQGGSNVAAVCHDSVEVIHSRPCAQARARSLAGFSEDAGEGKDDGDSASRRSYADDCDEHDDEDEEEEEEVLELTEQDLLRMLDAQEPSLQARCRCCPVVLTAHRSTPASEARSLEPAPGQCGYMRSCQAGENSCRNPDVGLFWTGAAVDSLGWVA